MRDPRRPQRWQSAGPSGNHESAVGRKILGQGDLNDRLCGTRAPSPGTSPSRSSSLTIRSSAAGAFVAPPASLCPPLAPMLGAAPTGRHSRGERPTPMARAKTYSVVEELIRRPRIPRPASGPAARSRHPLADTCGRAKTRGVRIGRPARLPVDQPGRWSGRFDDRARIRESTSLTWPRGSSASAVFVRT